MTILLQADIGCSDAKVKDTVCHTLLVEGCPAGIQACKRGLCSKIYSFILCKGIFLTESQEEGGFLWANIFL